MPPEDDTCPVPDRHGEEAAVPMDFAFSVPLTLISLNAFRRRRRSPELRPSMTGGWNEPTPVYEPASVWAPAVRTVTPLGMTARFYPNGQPTELQGPAEVVERAMLGFRELDHRAELAHAAIEWRNELNPAWEPAPAYDLAPAWEPAPAYDLAPASEPAPAYDLAPASEPAPAYDLAPASEPAPAYDLAPASEPAPAYGSAPGWGSAPVYNPAPAWEPTAPAIAPREMTARFYPNGQPTELQGPAEVVERAMLGFRELDHRAELAHAAMEQAYDSRWTAFSPSGPTAALPCGGYPSSQPGPDFGW